jgi:hypothetical protein
VSDRYSREKRAGLDLVSEVLVGFQGKHSMRYMAIPGLCEVICLKARSFRPAFGPQGEGVRTRGTARIGIYAELGIWNRASTS